MKKKLSLVIVLLLGLALVMPSSRSWAANNNLYDGGFETYPNSSWWYYSEPLGGVFTNGTLNNQNFWDNLWMPAPLCGHGSYNVGKSTLPLEWRNGSVPAYYFHWDGGTLYWQAAIKGPWFHSWFPVTAYSYAEIYLLDSQGTKTALLSDHQVAFGDDWARHYGSTSLGAGNYTLYMGRGASMEKQDANYYKYQLFYDDVFIGSSEPNHSTCQDSFESTPTWEPTQYGPTASPTSMETPTSVATPTPNQGWHFHTFTNSYNNDNGVWCPDGESAGGFYLDGATGWPMTVKYWRANMQYSSITAGGRARVTFNSSIRSSGLDWGNVTNDDDICADHGGCTSDGWISADFYDFPTHTGLPGAVACYGNFSPTATPTLSPTPGLSPTQTTKLLNCGFELGSAGWYFTPPSYVALAGGPAGPQYGVAVPNNQGLPNIFQNFYWPVSQVIYIQGWSKGQTQAKIWNIPSNFQFAVTYTGNDPDWVHWQYSASLSAGYYRLELNTFLPEGSEGWFDGVTLAADNYLNDAYCSMYTPTPGPTSNVTPTPGPSLTPSRTMTPRTSRTPWGTSTPWPSITASLTATAGNGQTATALASITPGGGGGGTQTPGPGDFVPPEQPPGGEGAPCQRPQTWTDSLNLGWWLDYEVCDVKRFLSWGPVANATAQAIPTMFANKEPFKTVGDITNGFHGMQTQIVSYNWIQTGFSGVSSTQVNPAPDKILNNNLSMGAPQDPWVAGGIISFSQTPNPNFFSKMCNTRLSNMLSARLAEGICFALNLTKGIGYLGWVSFFLNCACVFMIIREFLAIINYYGQYAKALSPQSAITEMAKGKINERT